MLFGAETSNCGCMWPGCEHKVFGEHTVGCSLCGWNSKLLETICENSDTTWLGMHLLVPFSNFKEFLMPSGLNQAWVAYLICSEHKKWWLQLCWSKHSRSVIQDCACQFRQLCCICHNFHNLEQPAKFYSFKAMFLWYSDKSIYIVYLLFVAIRWLWPWWIRCFRSKFGRFDAD